MSKRSFNSFSNPSNEPAPEIIESVIVADNKPEQIPVILNPAVEDEVNQ